LGQCEFKKGYSFNEWWSDLSQSNLSTKGVDPSII